MRVSLRRVTYILKNGIFKYVFREEKGDFSPANKERDVTEANESS
jgi:hypothetical protein